MTTEPTMEDILSSIKKIIAEDTTKGLSAPRPKKFVPPPHSVTEDEAAAITEVDSEDVLELTEAADTPEPPEAAPSGEEGEVSSLISPVAAEQSRSALDALSALVVRPEVAGTDTLEGLVREMLRPMLKEWLDANLPEVVERVVAKEVARISGR